MPWRGLDEHTQRGNGYRLYLRSPLLTRSRALCSLRRRIALSREVLFGFFAVLFMAVPFAGKTRVVEVVRSP